MPVHVKVAGAWKEVDDPHIRISGGTWKSPDQVHVKVAGAWKTVLATGPTVSPSTSNSTNTNFVPSHAYAGLLYNSSGVETGYNASGSATITRGNWLDSGLSSEVWVERTITAGSLNSLDAGAGRKQLSTTRAFRIIRTTVGTHTASVTFKFYDAASGGNEIGSVSVVFSATKSFG